MAPTIKLTYFPLAARAFVSRVCLRKAKADGKIAEFVDERLTFPEWGAYDKKGHLALGQLPALWIDDTTAPTCESVPISCYAAKLAVRPLINPDCSDHKKKYIKYSTRAPCGWARRSRAQLCPRAASAAHAVQGPAARRVPPSPTQGLYPSDPLEQLKADEVVAILDEVWNKIGAHPKVRQRHAPLRGRRGSAGR